ncbi:patatin-like protein [Kribbella kalugense]|uniref:Patatin-related protein n=1 Tax=Kribbella kalugense TaxID=2512221 RepID=A0A4V3G889_9ACTN|nr:patatin-like protein [Kribbella kalugense]TDW22034.1 patatin-related protein [Kribbella kalugense]
MRIQVPPVSVEPVCELRLALVCFGGVSLAIYMHGTTKEIHKLVRASCAYEDNQQTNPFTEPGERTEAAYWNLLKRKQLEDHGVRTRVVVDVITGTSAGGINGVCLATALARNASQDALRDLWMVEGDIGRLWRPALAGKIPWLSEHLHWKLRAMEWASWSLINLGRAQPPLRGDRMGRVLYDVLAGMTQIEKPTLVPDGLSLELFVTLTDLRGYRRFIRIADRTIDDKTHQVVMRFRLDAAGAEDAERVDDFTAADTGALSFAARATSSFPGAFPPVGLGSFDRDLRSDARTRDLNPSLVAGFLPAYRAPFNTAQDAWFIDGGVLDNKPFGLAIDAIVAKPAASEVRRWVVYLEPDPAQPTVERRDATAPTLLGAVIPSLSGIPRSEPILDELQRLRQFNERVNDIRRLVTPQVAALPTTLASVSALLRSPEADQMRTAMNQVHDQARQAVGTTYPTYLRLKLRSIHQALATAVASAYGYPPESAQAEFIRAVLGEWQDAKYGGDPTSADAQNYIRSSDVPYRVRRLRFVVQGVSDLYSGAGPELRPQLDAAKRQLYLFIDSIDSALAPDRLRDVLPHGGPFADDALAGLMTQELEGVARDHEAEVSAMMAALNSHLDKQLEGSSLEMLQRFNELSTGWDDELRNAVLVRFIGFPLWDTAIFPLMSLSEIQQFSPIRVARFSPDGATRLNARGAAKLQGIGVHHFGAFFSRKARECDYLWGRLDGAEQLVHLLGLESGAAEELYLSILDEEAAALPLAESLISACRAGLAGGTAVRG